jgi:hypothetical protein
MTRMTIQEESMEEMCRNCRFYSATAGASESGYCRRYPPVVPIAVQTEKVAPDIRSGVWAMVAPSAWCGEFVVRHGANER